MGIIIIIVMVVVVNVPSLPQSLSAKADSMHGIPLVPSSSAAAFCSPPAEAANAPQRSPAVSKPDHTAVFSVFGGSFEFAFLFLRLLPTSHIRNTTRRMTFCNM